MGSISRATSRATIPLPSDHHKHALLSAPKAVDQRRSWRTCLTVVRVLNGGDSYLGMWRKAVDREKKENEFQKLAQNLAKIDDSSGEGNGENKEVFEKKTEEFQKILETPKEERDRIQRMQVIDRAAAAIAAARSIIKRKDSSPAKEDPDNRNGKTIRVQEEGKQNGSIFITGSGNSGNGAPGPDFWSWIPPQSTDQISDDMDVAQTARQTSEYPILSNPVLEKDRSVGFLSIPFETNAYETNHNLPPFQSLLEVDKTKASELAVEKTEKEEHELEVEFSAHAAEVAEALHEAKELSSQGIKPDGTRWWRETGIEQRPDGVICRWTMIRGVGADQTVEWQEKYWEASDEFDYKELGSEKSGRDAFGNVWSENWRESMLQDGGLVHLEKTADKWGKNAKGEEWQEKWWEHYDASGKSEKWADKWCSIDPSTPLEAGHAHVWHERWGEKYDGYGGSVKYTDKWAERCEGDGWAKWGDKWDEHFDTNGHGVKQGETWWQGKHGDRWNRTWGERHNGSGWVHKYGKSSSGEHWDTHVAQETWFERFPHYGFYQCFDNSVRLREVKKPSEISKQQTI